MKNPISALKDFGVGMIVGKVLAGVAAGKYGTFLQRVYLHLNGLITIIGLALLFLAGGVHWLDVHGFCTLAAEYSAQVDCAAWAGGLAKGTAAIGAFCTWLGTVNGAVKVTPPTEAMLNGPALKEAIDSLRR